MRCFRHLPRSFRGGNARGVLLALVLGLGCGPKKVPEVQHASAQTAAQQLDRASAADNVQLATFDYLWQRVADGYPDPTMGGVDWGAVKTELRPKAAEAKTAADLRPVLREMLDRVGVSHFAIVSGDVYGGGSFEGPRGELGMDAALLGDGIYVLAIEKGRPASQEGIQPGDRLLTIGDTDLQAIVTELAEGQGVRGPAAAVGSVLRDLLRPVIGEPTKVTVQRGDDTHTYTLRPAPIQGQVFKVGELPATRVETHTHIDDPDGPEGPIPPVLVVRFSMFAVPNGAAIRQAVIRAKADGVESCVIDLRGNPGGLPLVAQGIAGHFVARKSASLGTFTTRESSLEFNIRPRVGSERLDGPLAILVDGRSASSSEIFASGMQELGRAVVVGEQSSGLALMSSFERLPNGDRAQLVFADLQTPGGHRLEGQGVTPDLVVVPTPQALREGRDPVLDAALAAVRAPEKP